LPCYFPRLANLTSDLPVVPYDAKAGARSLNMMRWGLIPYWAQDIKVGFANINAKAEGIDTRPAFRKESRRIRAMLSLNRGCGLRSG
jgi:putative SOS response-associated peptidase YedK